MNEERPRVTVEIQHADMLEAEAAVRHPDWKPPADRIADALETHNELMLQVLDKLEAIEMSLRPSR